MTDCLWKFLDRVQLECTFVEVDKVNPSRTAPSLIHSSIQPTVILDIVSSNYSSRVDLLYILDPLCICKVIVVAKQMLFIRILFHHPVVCNTLKHHLTETIILGNRYSTPWGSPGSGLSDSLLYSLLYSPRYTRIINQGKIQEKELGLMPLG